MDPNTPPAADGPKNKAVSDEKAEAREAWYKIVIKVLKWKEGTRASGTDPITDKEWNNYYKETIKINAQGSKDKTLKKLKETEDLIKKHGGFAK